MLKSRLYSKSYFTHCWIICIANFGLKTLAYCGGDVTGLHGVIQSPSYGQGNDIYDCTWKIAMQEGSYLKLKLDAIRLYYKDTDHFWNPSYSENVCSQSLEIGEKQINCLSNTKDCIIFRRNSGCLLPEEVSWDCYVYNRNRRNVPIHFTSDGESGISFFGKGNFVEENYPKGFKMSYSQNTCIQETTTETTAQTTRKPSTASQVQMTSASIALETTSRFISQGITFRPTNEIPTVKQQTTAADATNLFGNVTRTFQKSEINSSSLIALIMSGIIVLLLLIAIVIFVIWRKRNLHQSKSHAEVDKIPETVYSVAYGRLGAPERGHVVNQAAIPPTPADRNADDGFVYSVVAARQISNGEHPYVTVNDNFQTIPDSNINESITDDILYSSVTSTPSHDNTTKRKSTFRYQIQPKIAQRNPQSIKMVDNILYNV